MNLIVPQARTNYFRNSFASAGAKLWNSLPSSLRSLHRVFWPREEWVRKMARALNVPNLMT